MGPSPGTGVKPMLRNGKFEEMIHASGCFVGSNPRYRSVPQQEIAGDVSRSLDALQHNVVLPLPGLFA